LTIIKTEKKSLQNKPISFPRKLLTKRRSFLTRDVEAVEYLLLPLPASFFKVLPLPQKLNRFHIPAPCFIKICFRFRLFKMSNASEFASASSFFFQIASASTKI